MKDLQEFLQILSDGEIFAWYPSAVQKDSVTVDETEFTVKKWLDKNPLTCGEDAVSDNAVLVVTDEDFKKFDEMRTEMYKRRFFCSCGRGSDTSSWSGYYRFGDR